MIEVHQLTKHYGSARPCQQLARPLHQAGALLDAGAETVVTLLLCRRKPAAALAGILAVYLVFALDPLLLPAVLFALLTVAMERDRRTAVIAAAAAAAATAAWPYIGGRAVSFAGHTLPRLAAFGMAVAAGMYLRQRRNRGAVDPGQPPARPSLADVSTVRKPDL